MTQSLFEQTLKLIKHRPASVSIKQIARDTGISYNWLSSFHQEKIPDPKFNRLQTLHDYLIEQIKKVA